MRHQLTNCRAWRWAILSWLLIAATATAQGVLYEVSRPGAPPSYLFGTMHLDHPRVLSQLERVEPLLKRVDRLVMEMVPDGAAMLRAAAAGFYSGERTLKDDLEPPFYARVTQIMAGRGVPEMVTQRMKPWQIAVMLSLPSGDNAAFLDLRLFNRAEELGLPVHGLETLQEQLGLFDRLDTVQQVAMLEHTVEHLDELPGIMAEMIDAYERGDLARLERMSIEQQAGYDSHLAEWFVETMIERRNARMLERLRPLLAEGASLIAVGALHLPGPTGLLQGLEAVGYRLREVE